MKVRMKSTHESAPDGIHVGKFEKGKTYDLPEVAAKRFVAKGWASAVGKGKVEPEEAPVAEEPDETKVVEPPEIKEEAPPELEPPEIKDEEEIKDETPPETEGEDKIGDEEPPEEPKGKTKSERHKK